MDTTQQAKEKASKENALTKGYLVKSCNSFVSLTTAFTRATLFSRPVISSWACKNSQFSSLSQFYLNVGQKQNEQLSKRPIEILKSKSVTITYFCSFKEDGYITCVCIVSSTRYSCSAVSIWDIIQESSSSSILLPTLVSSTFSRLLTNLGGVSKQKNEVRERYMFNADKISNYLCPQHKTRIHIWRRTQFVIRWNQSLRNVENWLLSPSGEWGPCRLRRDATPQ